MRYHICCFHIPSQSKPICPCLVYSFSSLFRLQKTLTWIQKGGVRKFPRFKDCFRKAPFSWRLSVDGRPNRINKASVDLALVSYKATINCFRADYGMLLHNIFNDHQRTSTNLRKCFIYACSGRVTVGNLWKSSESVGANRYFLSHKMLCINASTSSHGLAIHRGHSLSSHRSVNGGFVRASQLMSLSLHSTERILIPEPQVTEHCKRTVNHIQSTLHELSLS